MLVEVMEGQLNLWQRARFKLSINEKATSLSEIMTRNYTVTYFCH